MRKKTLREKLYTFRKQVQRIFIYPALRREGGDYDAYWRDKRGNDIEALSDWQQDRADFALSKIGKGQYSFVDVGGGAGAVLQYFKTYGVLERGAVVDVSPIALEAARSFGFDTLSLDITTEEGRSGIPKADYMIFFEILEHIPKPEDVLESVLKKTNKAVFFSVPNTGFIVHRLRLFFGKFPLQWWLEPGEHLRYWTYTDMVWWLDSLGYKGRYVVHGYKGVPILKTIFPRLFSAGLVVELRSGQ